MGNCQAVDAAALVIQHPSGKQERMYWSITASEVMKMNPGHYVSLIIPLPFHDGGEENSDEHRTVRYTRVKLLRPTDTLVLGRAYRLVTTQGWFPHAQLPNFLLLPTTVTWNHLCCRGYESYSSKKARKKQEKPARIR